MLECGVLVSILVHFLFPKIFYKYSYKDVNSETNGGSLQYQVLPFCN